MKNNNKFIKTIKLFSLATTLAASSLMFPSVTQAEAKLGQEYVVSENKNPDYLDKTMIFFSFSCPHCYDFEVNFKIPQKILAKNPQQKFELIHVAIGPYGEDLTRAWALAKALGVEDKILEPLFDKTHSGKITGVASIRDVFVENGVSEKEFDDGFNSFMVSGIVSKQHQLIEQYAINGVPSYIVGGIYKMRPEGIKATSEQDFVNKYVNTVIELTNILKK